MVNKARPKLKESKQDLRKYVIELENAISKIRARHVDFEKDYNLLDKSYKKEIRKFSLLMKGLMIIRLAITRVVNN